MVTLNCKIERVDLIHAILEGLFLDLEKQHDINLERCRLYLFNRSRAEGIRVFTTLLPQLGKAIYSSFETGTFVCPTPFKLYRKSKVAYAYPAFLNSLFANVYDETGDLNEEPCISSLQSLIQLSFMFYKLEDELEIEKAVEVLHQFKRTEDEVISYPSLKDNLTSAELIIVQMALSELFRNFDPYDRSPKHGPGVTSDKVSGFDKYRATTYPDEARFLFPREDYLHVNSEYAELEKKAMVLENDVIRTSHGYFNKRDFLAQMPGGHGYSDFGASIKFVPKDSRGPRLISCEPALMQYLQQSVMNGLYDFIESHPLTSGHVNFTDQTINQRLVVDSSVSRERCTLDLREASDRVSNAHVQLFPEPIRSALLVLRSRKTSSSIDDDSEISLSKYAPMGSALCFPVEACVFWALGVAAIMLRNNISLQDAAKRIYVYGDDIIADTPDYAAIAGIYDRSGLLVNHEKSFHKGHFRESCGADYYKGVIMTPVRVKKLPSAYWLRDHKFVPKKRVENEFLELLSIQSLGDNLFKRGYWQTSRAIDNLLKSINKEFVAGLPGHGTLMGTMYFSSDPYAYGQRRKDDPLQHNRVRVYRSAALTRNRQERDDYLGYLQWFTTGSGLRKTPRGHFKVSRGWHPV